MNDKKPMILAGCGGLLAFVCFISMSFWGFMVAQDSGAISADEAMPGVFGSCCCLMISLGILGGGIAWMVKAKKTPA